ncbi:MAG: thioredoxin fold domain-containing protein [Chitinophagaceae bacterium]|nr:thioredoxin fold domain-containing protein [Chitinophagaceae bacterium]
MLSFLVSANIGFSQLEYNVLSVEDFQKSINHTNVQVLDVRTVDEYRSGHLKKSLQADWYKQQQFKERTSNMDKSKPVYVYCLTGVRSDAAVKYLKQVGFSNVFDLKGGLTAWKLANKPVEGIANVKQITLEEYKTAVSAKETVLVDFGAEWCPPCKKMEPIVAQLKMTASSKYAVINIDASTQTEMLKQMKVEALPVFIVYKNGKEVWRKQGVATFDELKKKLL